MNSPTAPRRRIRDWMPIPDRYQPGPRNTISDVPGVQVGHHTLIEGQDIRTGVTVVRPHAGDPFQLRCPCAVSTGNGYGKLAGSEQIDELGELESLIGLTNTLSVAQVLQGILEYHLAQLPAIRSINVVVGETNDGFLNDIRACRIRPQHALAAIQACSAEVAEGAVGAGCGTVCFGYKGGIGSASRCIPASVSGEERPYHIGALVQSNYGGQLNLYGRPLPSGQPQNVAPAGSCMIVLACDAPLEARQLRRLARRGILGLAYTGSCLRHGSGDFCIAFSNHAANLRRWDQRRTRRVEVLCDEQLDPFFEAAVEAVREAVYNSLCMASAMSGVAGHAVAALDVPVV